MNKIILLGIIGGIYYKANQYYPFSLMTHIYFGGFICGSLLLMYLMNYQQPFMFKMANNVKNTNNVQLHELVPAYVNSGKNNDIKYTLADKQLLRCKGCLNPIDLRYINEYKLSYITPLNMGGHNGISNICLLCPTCHNRNNLNNF